MQAGGRRFEPVILHQDCGGGGEYAVMKDAVMSIRGNDRGSAKAGCAKVGSDQRALALTCSCAGLSGFAGVRPDGRASRR